MITVSQAKVPFENAVDEANAIEAKVCMWRLKIDRANLRIKRRMRLALLIAEGTKAALRLRSMSPTSVMVR